MREVDRGRSRGVAPAVAAALVVAEAAVLLLRPRGGVLEPAPVDVTSYFSRAEIDRAKAYRRPQLVLLAGGLAIQGALLGRLAARSAARPPGRLRRPFRRPAAAAAAAGVGLSLALEAASLPLAAIGHRRAVRVGLSTQSWRAWAGDLAKSGAIGAAVAGAGAGGAVALMRRFGERWWIPAAGTAIAFGAAMTYAGPVVIDPLFNKFSPLPAGRARSDVLDLAREAGIEVGEVYVVDASRRTTAANAYVTGIWRTKRVVLFDTLLEHFTDAEVRLVVAHELAHVRHRDVQRGLLYLLVVAPAGSRAVARLTRRLAPDGEPGPAVLPALALSAGALSVAVGLVANQLSRRIETRADTFALRATDEPEPFVGFEKRITLRNIADPDPPAWVSSLLATHPPTVERIGLAKAYEAELTALPGRRTLAGS